jgi:hypothetical protein
MHQLDFRGFFTLRYFLFRLVIWFFLSFTDLYRIIICKSNSLLNVFVSESKTFSILF